MSSQLLERSCKVEDKALRFRVQKSLCLAMTQTSLDVIDLQIIAKANLVPLWCYSYGDRGSVSACEDSYQAL